MSITSKNRKKLSQTELRKFMSAHRKPQADVKKIDSPLAKYNELGQLTCVLCKTVVRSETVWKVHINAKLHKQNVEIAKKLKERTQNFTTSLKRPLSPPTQPSEKKLKSILKNSNSSDSAVKHINNLPENIVDSNNKISDSLDTQSQSDKMSTNMEVDVTKQKEVLPEGFFDDPKLDAKARNQEYKDPVEEEWDKFLKAIKEADSESNAIIAEDQEESTTERQIDEIDEQMKKLSRVLDLEKKKSQVIPVSNEFTSSKSNEDDDEDMEDDQFDEFLDWRAKKSFH